MSRQLDGKVVLITGAGTGIGRGIAEHCHDCGATVAVGTLEPSVSYSGFERVVTCEVDVRQPASIQSWVGVIAEQYGRIDGLVANAGVTLTTPFLETSVDDLEMLWQTNLRGVYLSAQCVAKHMVRLGCHGSIVNVASNHATASDSGYEIYAATKGGIVSMTRAMAWSLGEHGIRVNALSPGLTRTDTVQAATSSNPELETLFRSWHATDQYNNVHDIGRCAAFLLSDASVSVTGTELVADQGMSARLVQFPRQT